MRVLLCFDGSPAAVQAVHLVVARGWPAGSTFKIFSVLPGPGGEDFQQQALEPLVRRFGPQSVLCEERTAGNVGETIVHVAAQWQADLIAMGTRERVGLTKLILGSISDYVLKHAHCSVLIARATNHSFFLPGAADSAAYPPKILLCVDHYQDCLAAVSYLLSSSWPKDTHFVVLKVMEHHLKDFSIKVVLPWVNPPYEGDLEENAAIVDAANVVGHVSDVLEERFGHCQITELIQEGIASFRILSVAKDNDIDLIVMGARGAGAASARHHIGSVACRIAEEAPCSVQIVRTA